MHSILESDGVSTDPYEVLCYIGTLIIEGRTPKVVGDSTASGETVVKTTKPYNEGPHCPNFMKLYTKDTHNTHKCQENNILCIRYNNLKQHLQSLHNTSPSVCIQVSLGPDCLCGDLRSQSTLVSTQPSKRDIVLEQWNITISSKQMQEPASQMSVMNLYQAVRSLLHFSQLTAWYMNHGGMKPSNVIYRVGIPEDSTFISDDNFVSHDFPIADINKTTSIKISVKTLPRMKKIPSVYCPQHSVKASDVPQGAQFEGADSQKFNKEKSFLSSEPLHPKFRTESQENLLESSLPLKFQGVRKKTYEAQERKRKKHISLYGSPSNLDLENCTEAEFLDGIPIEVKKLSSPTTVDYLNSKRIFQGEPLKPYVGECSKTDYKKSKSSAFTDFVGSDNDLESFGAFSCNYFEEKMMDPTIGIMIGLKKLSDSKGKSDFRTKAKMNTNRNVEVNSESSKVEAKTVMDILDDRMQISCAISGKHHCKWECEEENDLNTLGDNVEKPKRRRSLSKARSTVDPDDFKPGGSDSEKILHGKFKEIDFHKSDFDPPMAVKEMDESEENPSSTSLKSYPSFSGVPCSRSDSPKSFRLESPPKPVINSNADISCSSARSVNDSQAPIIQSLPISETLSSSELTNFGSEEVSKDDNAEENRSSRKSFLSDSKGETSGNSVWVRTESLESFKRGCAAVTNSILEYSSGSEAELSHSDSETPNPFLAAILRTTKKSKKWNANRDPKIQKKCDSSIRNGLGEDRKGESDDSSARNPGSDGFFTDNSKNTTESHATMEKWFDSKAKIETSGKVQSGKEEIFRGTRGKILDLRMPRKKSSAVRNLKNLEGNGSGENSNSEFLSKSLSKFKSLFDKPDSKRDEKLLNGYEELYDDNSSSFPNSTKTIPVPSAHDKLKFRRSLDSAAQLVFHRCSGLPLTSSPAPVRRHNNSFSFDSSLNSVSAIKSALFEPANSQSSEDENESEGSLKSPASPGAWSKQINYHSLSPLPLLGSFEESVLNGRLEPVSTVQGFTAELGASGSFCPRHLYLPVTVFFYTLGDNDKVSAPYLGHINLGKKGYNVPRSGTIQVTLFNPMRTVVKMFVVVYDLQDMPPNSHTFIRQRTLYVPANQKESSSTEKKKAPFNQDDYHKYLRYLIHLRFVAGKTGRIYLHTDIRMVIFRKADEDTATALGNQTDGEAYELRSLTHGPVNPKFSPRK